MSIAINLLPETILVLEADGFASGIVRRSSNVPGTERTSTSRSFASISINANTTLEIGPFSEPRRYILETLSGTITRSYNKERLNYNHNGTGIYTGGRVTINGSDATTIDIEAGSGVVIDNYTNPGIPDVVKVTWPAFTGIEVDSLLTNFTSYIAVDRGGNIVQLADAITATDRRNFIILCVLAHTNNVVVETVANFPPPAYDVPHLVIDFADSVGIINRSGNQFSANGANLKVNKSAGESFRIGSNWNNSSIVPNITTDTAQTAPTMFFSYRDGSGGWVPPPFDDEINPGKYDDGSGTLANVSGGSWTIQRLFFEPIGEDIIIAYGQNTYNSQTAAEAAIFGETFIKNPVLNDTSFRGYLLVKGNATDLSNSGQAKFIAADKLGSGPSVGTSTATTDIQGAYDNSVSPELETDSTRGALTLKEGTGTATNNVLEVTNNSDTLMASIDGQGRARMQLNANTTANRPASPRDYEMYFDTTLGYAIWYDGSNWVNSLGVTV
tara:strand:- start:3566 stop:5062 length:1497 start_codon:yes stop_codon:yes gene_type:complete